MGIESTTILFVIQSFCARFDVRKFWVIIAEEESSIFLSGKIQTFTRFDFTFSQHFNGFFYIIQQLNSIKGFEALAGRMELKMFTLCWNEVYDCWGYISFDSFGFCIDCLNAMFNRCTVYTHTNAKSRHWKCVD